MVRRKELIKTCGLKHPKDNESKKQGATKGVKDVSTKGVKDVSMKDVNDVATKDVKDVATKDVKDVATKSVKGSATKSVKGSATKSVKRSATKGVKRSATKGVKRSATKGVKRSATKGVKGGATNKDSINPGTDRKKKSVFTKKTEIISKVAMDVYFQMNGVGRKGNDVYEEIRRLAEKYLSDIVKKAAIVTKHKKKVMITGDDIKHVTENMRIYE